MNRKHKDELLINLEKLHDMAGDVFTLTAKIMEKIEDIPAVVEPRK